MSVNNTNNAGPSAGASHVLPDSTPSSGAQMIEKPSQEETSKKPDQAAKKKWARREITMLGDDTCGGCKHAEDIINNQIKPNSDVETIYNKVYVDTKEGQQLRKEKNLQFIPFITECLIPTDPTEKPQCKEYKGVHEYNYKLKVNE